MSAGSSTLSRGSRVNSVTPSAIRPGEGRAANQERGFDLRRGPGSHLVELVLEERAGRCDGGLLGRIKPEREPPGQHGHDAARQEGQQPLRPGDLDAAVLGDQSGGRDRSGARNRAARLRSVAAGSVRAARRAVERPSSVHLGAHPIGAAQRCPRPLWHQYDTRCHRLTPRPIALRNPAPFGWHLKIWTGRWAFRDPWSRPSLRYSACRLRTKRNTGGRVSSQPVNAI